MSELTTNCRRVDNDKSKFATTEQFDNASKEFRDHLHRSVCNNRGHSHDACGGGGDKGADDDYGDVNDNGDRGGGAMMRSAITFETAEINT